MLRSVVMASVLLLPATTMAGGFGGFVAERNGARVGLVGVVDEPDRVCPLLSVSGQGMARGARPSCRALRDDELASRERPVADTGFTVTAAKRQLRVHSQGRLLVRWTSPQPIDAVGAVFVSADRLAVAVELTVKACPMVVAFQLAAPLPETAAAYERAMGKGGTWEQRMVACETAGVKLELEASRRFSVTIDTRCQGSRDRTRLAGTWVPEGADVLRLAFPQDEGPDEVMECRLAACADVPGEDCLGCAQDDIAFTLFSAQLPGRRPPRPRRGPPATRP